MGWNLTRPAQACRIGSWACITPGRGVSAGQLVGVEGLGVLLTTPSLLITDDDRDFRDTLCGLFASRGFRTLVAGDGEEALTIVQREPVHLVLLDMHMPKLSGLETLRRVKQVRELLPCILISADMDECLAEEARLAHAFSVLSKPVRSAEITRTVDLALQSVYHWHGQS
jgi:CheY-like chemotaxis protein